MYYDTHIHSACNATLITYVLYGIEIELLMNNNIIIIQVKAIRSRWQCIVYCIPADISYIHIKLKNGKFLFLCFAIHLYGTTRLII